MASLRVETILSDTTPSQPPLRIEERISIPAAIDQFRREDPERAVKIQRSTAERFQSAFDQGLAVIGFERTDTGGAYLLGLWP